MENLARIEYVRAKIRTAPRMAIRALHRFMFELDGDRQNRDRLREFTGFTFTIESDAYRDKLEYASKLSIGDLIFMLNVLGLNYSGNNVDIRVRLMHGLIDINTLINDEEDNDEQGAESESDTVPDPEDNTEEMEIQKPRQNDVAGAGYRKDDRMRFAMSYRDIEDSIRPFSESDDYPIER